MASKKTKKPSTKGTNKGTNKGTKRPATHTGMKDYIGVTDYGVRVKWGSSLTGSSRTDYGKTIDLSIPVGYHDQVTKVWQMYNGDRLFRYLIDRVVDFACGPGFEWEVPIVPQNKPKQSWRNWFKKKDNQFRKDAEREKRWWDTWAAQVNRDVNNIIPGMDEVVRWIAKQLLLSGMAALDWDTGPLYGGRIAVEDVPIRIAIHNPSGIVLQRNSMKFGDESTYLKISATEAAKLPNKDDLKPLPSGGGQGIKLDPKTSYIIKYNYTPGDLSESKYQASGTVSSTIYPIVPFVSLNDVLVMRRALAAADIAILNGIINFILWWEIGDEANPPKGEVKDTDGTVLKKSTVDEVKEIIKEDEDMAKVLQFFLPYYIKPHILIPETEVLLSSDKWVQSSIEMMQAFGILIPPGQGVRLNMAEMNTQNFEEMLGGLRQHIKRAVEGICARIVRDSGGKLTTEPNMIWKPLNTKDSEFRERVWQIARMGRVSTETLLTTHGLDHRIEDVRIADEIDSGKKDMYDKNVPISFKQQAGIGPSRSETPSRDKRKREDEVDREVESRETPLQHPGRPKTKVTKKKEGE